MDAFRPTQWHDFFMTVGAGSAALSGLVVVAVSQHVEVIARDPVLRHRGRSILTGMAALFVRCALALMGGQSGRVIGVEFLFILVPISVGGLVSFLPVVASETGAPPQSTWRTVGSLGCYVTESIGAALLVAGTRGAIYVVAIAMLANFFFTISGAWLLMIGVSSEEEAA
jgi:hypothetical protein